jgi:hypothetical protein
MESHPPTQLFQVYLHWYLLSGASLNSGFLWKFGEIRVGKCRKCGKIERRWNKVVIGKETNPNQD